MLALQDEVDDWAAFYVNMCVMFSSCTVILLLIAVLSLLSFVDRDMFMHHIGGGVGHSIIDLAAQDPGGGSDMDNAAAGTEDEDNIDYEDDAEESEDSKDDFNYDEEDDGDLDDGEDAFGPEDGEDGDFDDHENGFTDF